MSKNLTRKGLALGAIVALGSSLFAGAPAFAGTETAKVTLVPSAGTTYTTLIGASFDLKTELDDTLDNIDGKTFNELTYIVTNSSAQKLAISLDGASGASFGNVDYRTGDVADTLGSEVSAAASVPATTGAGTAKVISVTHNLSSQSADNDDVGANTLRITSSTDSTDAFSVTVQAFLDDDNDGVIDSLEYTSPVRTLNFIKASAATVTTTVSSAVVGTSTIQGTVVIGNDVNNRSLVGQISIGFFKNASAVKILNSGSASVDTIDLEWDTDNSVLKNVTYKSLANTASGTGNTITQDSYTAKAYFGVARSVIGEASAIVAPVVGTVTSADATDYLVATADANTKRTSVTATTARAGYTGAIKLTSQVLNAENGSGSVKASDDASVVAIAGVKVKVTLTKGSTFGSTHEVTAGGVKLTATSGAVSYETTTDAAGAVSVSPVSNKGTDGDSYSVSVSVLNETGWQAADSSLVTFTAATISSTKLTNLVGTNAQLSVAKGGTLPLSYEVRDDFGGLSSVAGTYRLSFGLNGSSTGGATVAGTAAVSGGKASFNLVDNTITATGTYVVRATLEKLNTAGTAYESVNTSDVTVNVGTSAVTAISVPADEVTAKALEPKDFVTHDLRLDANSKTYAGIGFTSGNGFTVTGYATSANGAAVPGAAVKISAKGLQFVAENANTTTDATLAVDSITVYTDNVGAYTVKAFSHTAGTVAITVTSGSATKSVNAKYAFATTADKNSKLEITGAATTKAGRSTGYVVALTDKWGNAIKGAVTIKVEQAGAGYLTSTPTAVSAVDGKTNVTLITQPADGGLTTITVTYDVAASDTDVVAKKSILVGVSASVSAGSKKANVVVKNASGLTVKVVSGTKSTTKTATSDSYKLSLSKLTSGSKTVKVYVDGVLVASKKVTVKK